MAEDLHKHLDEQAKARFQTRVSASENTDACWEWQGGLNRGYGAFYLAGKNRQAHRVAWIIHNDEPFPDGMIACHSCDNPRCVNPHHIWPGTHLDNLTDAINKGRKNLPRTHCKNGHSLRGENRQPIAKGYVCKKCHRAHILAYRPRANALRNERRRLYGRKS